MSFKKFNYKTDFEKILKEGLSQAQIQLLKELLHKNKVDEKQLFNIMHKKPEAIGFKEGDHVLYIGYTHLRPDQTEFEVHKVTGIHLDYLTDVKITPIKGGASKRVYHSDLIKIKQ